MTSHGRNPEESRQAARAIDKNCGGDRDGPLRQKIPSIDYWSNFRTACSFWLACARAEMPVCSRT